jgi:predicted site-specific integrase-resolvase
MEQRYNKLSEYAKIKGITYKTAWNHFKKGIISGAFLDESNHVLIPIKKEINNKAIIYARVSSNERKESLLNQQKRLEDYASHKNFEIISSYKEIASGMNDNRPILNKILNDNSWNVLIVENKDRLTRFGFNYIKNLLKKQNKEILVLNQTDNDNDDLMKDLVSVIYSFSARMYGLRRKKNKEEIIKFIES